MPADSIANLPPFITRILRDALFGGRTEAKQLFFEKKAESDEQGRYLDVNSLYPFVNATCEYPDGHPELLGIAWNLIPGTPSHRLFKLCKATGKESWEYMGSVDQYLKDCTLAVINCDVECPKTLLHPVLPSRRNGKLMFDLLPKQDQWYTSVELKQAIQHGYKVTRVHNVALWHKTRKDLFQQYVQKFLKVKDEASGWQREEERSCW